MKAREIMTRDVSVVMPSQGVADAAAIMRDLGVGFVPVVEETKGMKLVGVLTDRDIAVRCVAAGHAPGCEVATHMSRAPFVAVTPDATVEEVLAAMEDERVRRVVVLDANGTLQGVIAQADLALQFGPTHPAAVEHLLEAISEPAPA